MDRSFSKIIGIEVKESDHDPKDLYKRIDLMCEFNRGIKVVVFSFPSTKGI